MAEQKKYATVDNPTIEAVTSQFFRFENSQQATARIAHITESFIISKDQPEQGVRLWIRGFSLTEEDLAQGFKGHYARILPKRIGDGKWTLYAEKEFIELKNHPQKVRPKTRHPNWGHPILRAIKKGRSYETLEEAMAELDALHAEYPETSIPNRAKIYLMIYQKDTQPKVQKFVLEVKVQPDGSFKIEAQANEGRKSLPGVKAKPKLGRISVKKEEPETPPDQPPGFFASSVMLRRQKKKR